MSDTPDSNNKPFKRQILDNGVKLVHEHRKKPPVVAVKVFLPVGSSNDPEGSEGLAHLTARTLIQQTAKKTMIEMNRYKSRYGLKVSSSVHPDFTLLSFTSIPEYREELLSLVREILTKPSFNSNPVTHLKKQQLASLSRRRDDAFKFAFDGALEAFYRDHPYGHPPLGTLKAVQNLQPANARTFYRNNYSTKNLVVSSIGDLKIDRLESLFSLLDLPGKSVKETDAHWEDYTDTRQKRPRDVDQPTHVVLYPAPNLHHQDYVELKVTDALLGGGMSSVLFQSIRDQRSLGYQVGSAYPSRRLKSTFRVYLGGGSKDGTTFKQVLEKNLRKLAENPPDTESLNKAKEHLKGNFLLDHESPSRVAWYRGFYEVMGLGANFDELYPKKIETVTARDVSDAIKLLIEKEPLHFTVVPERTDEPT